MSLTVSFSIAQSVASPGNLTFTDASTGADASITMRRVTIRLADGTYLVPSGTTTDYFEWAYADATKTVTVLDRSRAATVTVQWLAGSTIVYTTSNEFVFNRHDYQFAYQKLQEQASTLNPNILQDINFYESNIRLITNIFNSEIAISEASDVTGSQFALDRNYVLVQNSNKFF